MDGIAPEIICVSLNPSIDIIVDSDGIELDRTVAGKGINIARVLAMFGISSTVTGFAGRVNRDLFDTLFRNDMISDGLLTLDGSTRENVTTLRSSDDCDHIRSPGLSVTAQDIRELHAQLTSIACPGDLFIFSGSLPPGMGPASFSELIQDVGDCGAEVAVDTSGTALRSLGKGRLWAVSPNAEELEVMTGRELPDREALCKAGRALAQKAIYAIVSAGEDGAFLFHERACIHATVDSSCRPDTVSTVGAGDVLLASFIASISQGLEPVDAIAGSVAAATASIASSRPAEVNCTLFESLSKNVLVEKIS